MTTRENGVPSESADVIGDSDAIAAKLGKLKTIRFVHTRMREDEPAFDKAAAIATLRIVAKDGEGFRCSANGHGIRR